MSEHPVIGPEEHFYGYIVGLCLEPQQTAVRDLTNRRILATFEKGTRDTWVVPDLELYQLLATELESMVWHQCNTDEFGYAKLYIKHDGKAWQVTRP